MFFPFAVRQSFRIATNGGISSGPYVLNHIAGYMDDFGMQMLERTDMQLSYVKAMPGRTYDRKGALRNVVFRVEFPGDDMKVTLESETILFTMIGVLAGLMIFLQAQDFPIWMLLIVVTGIWTIGWLQKTFVLSRIKHELIPILEAI